MLDSSRVFLSPQIKVSYSYWWEQKIFILFYWFWLSNRMRLSYLSFFFFVALIFWFRISKARHVVLMNSTFFFNSVFKKTALKIHAWRNSSRFNKRKVTLPLKRYWEPFLCAATVFYLLLFFFLLKRKTSTSRSS